MELEQAMKKPPKEKKKKKRKDHDDSSEESSEEESSEEEDEEVKDVQLDAETMQKFENKKSFLLGIIKINKLSNMSFRKSNHILTYDSAALVARYLASKRPFSQSFDIYLTQVSVVQRFPPRLGKEVIEKCRNKFRGMSVFMFPDFKKLIKKLVYFRKICPVQKNKKFTFSDNFNLNSDNFDQSDLHL